jgi:hypothetical protein
VIYELGPDDDYADEALWIRANPNLDVSVSRESLRKIVQKAKESPALEAEVKRLHFNIRTKAAMQLISTAAWDECGRDGDAPPVTAPAGAGRPRLLRGARPGVHGRPGGGHAGVPAPRRLARGAVVRVVPAGPDRPPRGAEVPLRRLGPGRVRPGGLAELPHGHRRDRHRPPLHPAGVQRPGQGLHDQGGRLRPPRRVADPLRPDRGRLRRRADQPVVPRTWRRRPRN